MIITAFLYLSFFMSWLNRFSQFTDHFTVGFRLSLVSVFSLLPRLLTLLDRYFDSFQFCYILQALAHILYIMYGKHSDDINNISWVLQNMMIMLNCYMKNEWWSMCLKGWWMAALWYQVSIVRCVSSCRADPKAAMSFFQVYEDK